MKTSLEILQALGEQVMGRLKCKPCDLRLWSYCWMQGLIPINVILNTRPIYWCISNHMQSLEKMGQKVKHHKAQWSINLLERSFKIILLDVIFLCRYFTWPQRAFYCLSLMAQATVLSWSAQNANAPWTLQKRAPSSLELATLILNKQ